MVGSGPGNYPLVLLATYVVSAASVCQAGNNIADRHGSAPLIARASAKDATCNELRMPACRVECVLIRSCERLLGHSAS